MKNGAPPLPPGKNAGPARPRRVCRVGRGHAVHAYAFADEDNQWQKRYCVAYACGARSKTRFPADDFLGQSRGLSHRNAACAGARLSFLLAGVEAASPRGIYN